MIPFTDEEIELIRRLSVRGGWVHPDARPLKVKIKKSLRNNGPVCCCYCRCGMNGWHPITIDIEHVLPKQQNPAFTFDWRNLGLSCKRCNMGIKGDDESFYRGAAVEKDRFHSEHYLFIHPYLDRYSNHLKFISVQKDDKFFVTYIVVNESAKGAFTRAYFRLQELETNTLDDVQGLEPIEISSTIPPEIQATLRQTIERLEVSGS